MPAAQFPMTTIGSADRGRGAPKSREGLPRWRRGNHQVFPRLGDLPLLAGFGASMERGRAAQHKRGLLRVILVAFAPAGQRPLNPGYRTMSTP